MFSQNENDPLRDLEMIFNSYYPKLTIYQVKEMATASRLLLLAITILSTCLRLNKSNQAKTMHISPRDSLLAN